jgi:hypothetical protein
VVQPPKTGSGKKKDEVAPSYSGPSLHDIKDIDELMNIINKNGGN